MPAYVSLEVPDHIRANDMRSTTTEKVSGE